jgi:PIN domain nuclease of toxin-antitoxin system
MSDSILLDTHAAIWLVEDRLPSASISLIADRGLVGRVFVSPISAWEIGLLAHRTGSKQYVRLSLDPVAWYRRLLENPLLNECSFTGEIAMAATCLPGTFHQDPADRFLVATARALDCALITRDQAIHDYAGLGHVKAIAC